MTLPVNQVVAPRRRGRTIMAIVLVVLAGLCAALGNVAIWSRDTALDTDTYVDTVVPLADNEQLTTAVSDELTQQLLAVVDLEDLAASLLPPTVAPLAGRAESLLRPIINDLILDALQSDTAGDLWETLNRTGHELLVEVLRGDNEFVSIKGDDVVVDLSPAVAAVDERLDRFGLSISDRVPNELTEFTILQSEEVGDAVDAIDRLEFLAVGLPVAALVFLIVGVAIAPRRLRTIGWAGVAIAGTALLVLLVEAIARQVTLGRITEPIAELAGRSLWEIASGRLVSQTVVLVAIGAALAVGGFAADRVRRSRSQPIAVTPTV